MTPSMKLSALIGRWQAHPDYEKIRTDLAEAFALGHEFGLQRAVETVDLHAAQKIRALKVVRVEKVETTQTDFLG